MPNNVRPIADQSLLSMSPDRVTKAGKVHLWRPPLTALGNITASSSVQTAGYIHGAWRYKKDETETAWVGSSEGICIFIRHSLMSDG